MALGRFAVQVEQWVAKSKKNSDQAVRAISLELFKRLVLKSPVDTGRFRGNWNVGLGAPTSTIDEEKKDTDGAETIAAAQAALENAKAGEAVFLTNHLPYAVALEYGHSGQAPNGMVRVTMEEVGAVTQDAAKVWVP